MPSADELRSRIPGWGADLDPADRPSVPREIDGTIPEGTSGDLPEEQTEHEPRERSIEHARLTPVFGTSCPPRGVSGAIRKLAYARYSEARAAHWLLLLAADRVESKAHALRSLATRRPDNPVTETGVLSEARHHGLSSRVGHNRVDVVHHPLDPVIVGAPWVLGAWATLRVLRRLR
ncbi:hypothetical protein F0U47_00055 [Nocardioides antri]|uniref:Uncharacterized protein n=1 Tax=Nocardioides antri TaxID=2607659 RepID=A0A5B1M989_9ACTN|nr:hypothetical protein F0U47_00055 [Nocardioides antri]